MRTNYENATQRRVRWESNRLDRQVVDTSQYFKHSVRKDEIEVRVRRREDRGVDCKRIMGNCHQAIEMEMRRTKKKHRAGKY